jgi:uncharacterized repeat protein (TIGR01451 family)
MRLTLCPRALLALTIASLPAIASAQVTFSRGSMTIPTNAFSPNYPTSITVSGITAPVTKVRLTLNGLNCPSLGAIDVLLRDPTGDHWLVLMSGVRPSSFNGDLTFDQAAGSQIPTGTGTAVTPGTYRPTSTNATVQFPLQEGQPLSFTGADVAPSGGSGSMNKFIGVDANGSWAIWLRNSSGNATVTGVTLEISTAADLSIVKSHTASQIKQGDTNVHYSIVVTNSGAAALGSQTVTVTDALPSGLTATSFSGTGWTCAALPALSCTRTTNDGLAAQMSYPTLDLAVNVASNAPTTVTNTATVTTSGDVVPGNNSSSDFATIYRQADLSISITDNVSTIVAGNPVSYTIVASNLGSKDMTGVGVSAGLSYLNNMTFTAVGSGGASGFTASGANFISDSNVSLPNGGSVTYTVNATLSPSAQGYPAGTFSQTVYINGPSYLFDPDTSNNTATDTDALSYVADLSIVKTGPATVNADTDVTWSISVTNTGPSDARNVTLSDTLPIPFVSQTQTGSFYPYFNVTQNGDTITDTTSVFPVGTTATFEFVGHVPPATTPGSAIVNTATITSADDAATANNSSTTTAHTPAPDLAITKTHTDTFKQGDAAHNYTIKVTNSGTSATSGTVTVTESVPAGLVKTNMTGTDWTCLNSSCSRSDALAPGATYPDIVVTVSVNANAPASVDNIATVSGGSEANTANDSATDTTVIIQAGDLTVAQSHTGGDFLFGQTGATLTFTVTNNGTGPTTGTVTVTEVLGGIGLTPTGMSGSGWTCNAGTLICTTSNAIAAGASYPTITLTFDIEPDSASPVASDVTVSGGGEINFANDASHFDVNVLNPWGPPFPFLATTQLTGDVATGWGGVSGAVKYAVFRSTSINGPWTEITQVSALAYLDGGLTPYTTYVYKVQSIDGNGQRSAFSTIDPATTLVFNDDPLNTGTLIKAAHLQQLRVAVQAMRAAANLPQFNFTDPALGAGTIVKAVHVQELQTALTAARNVFNLPNLYPTPIVPGTIVQRTQIQNLRSGVK